jgi:hypothetical protein
MAHVSGHAFLQFLRGGRVCPRYLLDDMARLRPTALRLSETFSPSSSLPLASCSHRSAQGAQQASFKLTSAITASGAVLPTSPTLAPPASRAFTQLL